MLEFIVSILIFTITISASSSNYINFNGIEILFFWILVLNFAYVSLFF